MSKGIVVALIMYILISRGGAVSGFAYCLPLWQQ
jgi:hypothetical protein